MDKKLKNVDFIKTILMVVIVFYHSIIFLSGNWFNIVEVETSKLGSYLVYWMNSFHIYAFTLVSGYIFYYIKYEKKRYKSFSVFLNNKFKRLIVPYVFVLIVWIIPIYIFFYGWNFSNIVKNFILGVSPNQLWFLLMLFLVFIIFWPLSDYFKNRKLTGIVVVLIIYCIGLFGTYISMNIYQIWTACKFILFFYLGFKMRQGWDSYISRVPFFVYIIVDIMLFLLVCVIKIREGIIWSVLNLGLVFLLNIIGSLMVWTSLQFIADHVKWESSKSFEFIHSRSMIVYLFHQQIIYFCIKLLNGVVNNYILVVINFIISFVLSLFIATFLLRYKFTRFLIGQKNK